MSRGRSELIMAGLLLGMAAAWAASARVQLAIDREKAQYQDTSDVLWIHSGKVLKKLSLGQNGLLADIYWTRAVQYYGGQRRDHKTDFSLLEPLLDITTDLDPYLLVAYKFGAVFLCEPSPRGAGRPREAVRLIRKGIQANPDDWRLWHDLGFIYYWDLKDYPAAAAAYLEGSKNPHAEAWMKVMAAVILQKGRDLETSRFLWSQIYRSTEDAAIRQNALEHLEALQAMENIEQLEKRVQQFHDKTGQWPRSFSDLVSQGLLAGIPTDPLGQPYQLGPNGAVRLSPNSKIRLEEIPPSS